MRILVAAGKHFRFVFDPDQPLKDYGEIQRDLLYYGVESEAFKRHFLILSQSKGRSLKVLYPVCGGGIRRRKGRLVRRRKMADFS